MSRVPSFLVTGASVVALFVIAGVISACGGNAETAAVPALVGGSFPVAAPVDRERLIPELNLGIDPVQSSMSRLPVPYFEVRDAAVAVDARLPVPDDLLVRRVVSRSDGSVIVLGDRRSAVEIMGFSSHGHMSFAHQADEAAGEAVHLVGGADHGVVLQRYTPVGITDGPGRLVVLDPISGAERVLRVTHRAATHGDISAGMMVTATTAWEAVDKPCWAEVSALDGSAVRELSLPDCEQVVDVSASPDGRFIALAYGLDGDLRLSVFDLSYDRRVDHPTVFSPRRCERCLYASNGGYLGLAWSEQQVLVAVLDPVPLVDGLTLADGIARRVRLEAHPVPY